MLMQPVADQPALISELRDLLDRLVVDGKDADAGGAARQLVDPSRAPAGFDRAVPRLGHNLRRDRDPSTEGVLGVFAFKRAITPKWRREDVRVDEDGAVHSSSASAAANASRSSSLRSGMSS